MVRMFLSPTKIQVKNVIPNMMVVWSEAFGSDYEIRMEPSRMGLVLYKRHQRKLLCPFRHVKVRQKDHNLGSRSSPDAESAFLGPFLLQNCEKEMFVVYELVGPWYFCYSSHMRLRHNLFHKHFYFEFTMTCNLL